MTVSELIEKLKKYDGEKEVYFCKDMNAETEEIPINHVASAFRGDKLFLFNEE